MTKPDYLIILSLTNPGESQQAIAALNGLSAHSTDDSHLGFGARVCTISQADELAQTAVAKLEKTGIHAQVDSVKYLSFKDYAATVALYS